MFLLETSLKYLVHKKYVMLCRNGVFIINGSIWVVAFYNGSISARGLNNNLDAHTPLLIHFIVCYATGFGYSNLSFYID